MAKKKAKPQTKAKKAAAKKPVKKVSTPARSSSRAPAKKKSSPIKVSTSAKKKPSAPVKKSSTPAKKKPSAPARKKSSTPAKKKPLARETKKTSTRVTKKISVKAAPKKKAPTKAEQKRLEQIKKREKALAAKEKQLEAIARREEALAKREQELAKKLEAQEKKLKAQEEKLSAKKLKAQEEVSTKKPISEKPKKAKKEKPVLVVSPRNKEQEHVLERAGIYERPEMCPTFEQLDKSLKKSYFEKKELVGRAVKERRDEKITELERKWRKEGISRAEIKKRLLDKQDTARTGVRTYARKRIDVEKMHVDFDPENAVMIFPEAAEATAVSLLEFFRPYAEEFIDKQRGNSEEAYIMRVKTMNTLPGVTEPREEGIGTERTQLTRSLTSKELSQLRKQFPELSDDQLLRRRQMKELEQELKELFKYFVNRYETYMGRKYYQTIEVTGFSIEVVKRVTEENVDRRDK